MMLRRWSIGKRLGIGYGLMLVITAFTVIYSTSSQATGGIGTAGVPDRLIACLPLLLCGALLAWRITLSITRPIDEALSIARKVATGDLSSNEKQTGQRGEKDEIAELLQSLGSMNSFLRTIVSEVRQGAEAIDVAAREIASGNADLSARTEAQAGFLEQTSASMQQLVATVKQNAERARQAEAFVTSSVDTAASGGQAVFNVVRTMHDIKESAQAISEIVGVIDRIAAQTNILALNAAVEAAQAGEHGRGFAVVAAEVRALAQRAAVAAREIKHLIASSADRVEMGSELVISAGATMTDMVQSVGEVAELVRDIATTSREQSSGIVEVNQAVSDMDGMTQQNAALVEQAAAAATSLQDQAAMLAASVRYFRLENSRDAAVAMVARAVALVNAQGVEAACKAFSKPDPQFKVRDLYINAIDMHGITMAHGENTKLIGKNLIGLKDADGKLFIKEFVSVASREGKGWITYRWPNPVTGIVEAKSTFITAVDGLIIGCGIYC